MDFAEVASNAAQLAWIVFWWFGVIFLALYAGVKLTGRPDEEKPL